MGGIKSRREPSVYDGIDDPDELAWALRAYGDLGNPDPEIEELQRKAGLGAGSNSQILTAATVRMRKPRGMKRKEARFARTRKFHPALNGFTAVSATVMAGSEKEANEQHVIQAVDPAPGPQRAPEHSVIVVDSPQATPAAWIGESFSPFPIPPTSGSSSFDPTKHKRFFAPWETEPKTTKSSTLSGLEALKAYNALAFAMRQYGRPMNTHIVIIWEQVVGTNQIKATKMLTKYLEGATKWLKVGSKPRRNVVRDPRKGEQMHYLWVHENAPGRGFHTHILTHIPLKSRKAFAQWSERCLTKLCKRTLGRDVFRLVPGYGDEEAQVRNTWRWFRYLMKQLDGNATLRVFAHGKDPERVQLRGLIKPWHERPALPIAEIRRAGVSHSIGDATQRVAGFQSALMASQLEDIFSAQEFRDWRRQHQLDGHFPIGI